MCGSSKLSAAAAGALLASAVSGHLADKAPTSAKPAVGTKIIVTKQGEALSAFAAGSVVTVAESPWTRSPDSPLLDAVGLRSHPDLADWPGSRAETVTQFLKEGDYTLA